MCIRDRGRAGGVAHITDADGMHPRRKPDLCVLDAYMPMVRNGPVGKDTNDLVERLSLIHI